MAGPPPGVQPPLPGGAQAPQGVADNERLQQLIALLHAGSLPGQQQPGPELEQQAEALNVEAIIKQLPEQPPPQYGELPGLGYLYPDDPTTRQQALVKTDPEIVRNALLRAIETSAFAAMLPFSENKPDEHGKAILAMAQAYLLLDPSVDEEGVPVGAKEAAAGDAQTRVAEAQSNGQLAATHAQSQGQHSLARLNAALQVAQQPQDSESFSRAPATGGHAEPPRVKPNAAETRLEAESKGKTDVLKGARGDLPRPKPRVGE